MPHSLALLVNGLFYPTVYEGDVGKVDLQADFDWQAKIKLDLTNSPYDLRAATAG